MGGKGQDAGVIGKCDHIAVAVVVVDVDDDDRRVEARAVHTAAIRASPANTLNRANLFIFIIL